MATTPTIRAVQLTAVALVVSTVLAACGARTQTAPVTGAATRGPDVVMIIRHGEKPDHGEHGLDANGNDDKSSLTATGWDRAHRLVGLFDPADGALRPGLVRPQAIYAANSNDNGEGARTRETVAPLATALGVAVDTDFGKGDEKALAHDVLARPGTVLISWQHSGIPTIADAFPSVTPTPPKKWPDDTFDVAWTLTRTADGWHFAQIPELLLPGDDTQVVPG